MGHEHSEAKPKNLNFIRKAMRTSHELKFESGSDSIPLFESPFYSILSIH